MLLYRCDEMKNRQAKERIVLWVTRRLYRFSNKLFEALDPHLSLLLCLQHHHHSVFDPFISVEGSENILGQCVQIFRENHLLGGRRDRLDQEGVGFDSSNFLGEQFHLFGSFVGEE